MFCSCNTYLHPVPQAFPCFACSCSDVLLLPLLQLVTRSPREQLTIPVVASVVWACGRLGLNSEKLAASSARLCLPQLADASNMERANLAWGLMKLGEWTGLCAFLSFCKQLLFSFSTPQWVGHCHSALGKSGWGQNVLLLGFAWVVLTSRFEDLSCLKIAILLYLLPL